MRAWSWPLYESLFDPQCTCLALTERQAIVRAMPCIIPLDQEMCYYLINSVHPRLCQEYNLQRWDQSRLLRCNGCHWRLRHDHHHTRPSLLRVVLLACFPRGLVCIVRAMCEQWGSCILVGTCPIEALSSRRPGPGLIVA
jgi:hypothetical protein